VAPVGPDSSVGGDVGFEDVHYHWSEDVHPEEAEVVPGAQAGHYERLLGLGGRGLLDHLLDAVEALAALDTLASHRAEEGQQVLARGLHARDGASVGDGGLNQLLRAALVATAEVNVVTDHVQEWLAAHELAGAEDRVPVSAWLVLRHEAQPLGPLACHLSVGGLITRANHHADLLDARAPRLLDDHAQHRLLMPIAVH
jgi:hypothetical protein